MIDATRKQVAVTANAALTALYWQIGRRVHTQVLDEKRAEYGANIVAAVGRQLGTRYGRGFDEKSLRRMIRSGFPRCRDCRRTVATIDLGTFQDADPATRWSEA